MKTFKKYFKEKSAKTVQQYIIPWSDDMKEYGVRLGAFLCHNDEDDLIHGFVSDFDEEYVEFTMFEPAPVEDFPKDMIVLQEEMTMEEVCEALKYVKDNCDEEMLEKWVEIADEDGKHVFDYETRSFKKEKK